MIGATPANAPKDLDGRMTQLEGMVFYLSYVCAAMARAKPELLADADREFERSCGEIGSPYMYDAGKRGAALARETIMKGAHSGG